MSQKQRIVVWIGMLAVIVAVAYLPWNYTVSRAGAAVYVRSTSYHFVTSPPVIDNTPYGGIEVDWPRVLLELAAVAVVTGGLYATLADRKAIS